MREIVDWLRQIEERAHDLYSQSSLFFESDRPLSEFLARMARDEASHYHLMGSASDYLRRIRPPVESAIDLGSEQTDSIETTLKEAQRRLEQHVLSAEQLLDTIVHAEWSEWNAIFVYVLNTLKEFDKRFQYMASVIQTHQSMIVSFLESHPAGRSFAERVRMLPKVWDVRILIVEDSEPLCLLLKDLVADQGDVETAGNGREALKKTRKSFFDVIIADIDMPVMNGLEFYSAAVEEDPRLQGRFVFCSGLITERIEAFLNENNLFFLKKPFQVQDIRNVIKQISTLAN
ncbi:MAG: response regulator [Pseudomonadota bacterium]